MHHLSLPLSLSHFSYLLASLQLLIANKGAKLKSNDNKSYHFTVAKAINVNSPIEYRAAVISIFIQPITELVTERI